MSSEDSFPAEFTADPQELESRLIHGYGGIELDISIGNNTGIGFQHMSYSLGPESQFIQPPPKNITNKDWGNFSASAPGKVDGAVKYWGNLFRPPVRPGEPEVDPIQPSFNVKFEVYSGLGAPPPKVTFDCNPLFTATVTVRLYPGPPRDFIVPEPLRLTRRWRAVVVFRRKAPHEA